MRIDFRKLAASTAKRKPSVPADRGELIESATTLNKTKGAQGATQGLSDVVSSTSLNKPTSPHYTKPVTVSDRSFRGPQGNTTAQKLYPGNAFSNLILQQKALTPVKSQGDVRHPELGEQYAQAGGMLG